MEMSPSRTPNLAKILYRSYPESDLLPLDPKQDCRNLQALHRKAMANDLGDTLFQFLVLEIVEGGGRTLAGAIRVVSRARDDVEAVLAGLQGRASTTVPGQCRQQPEAGVPRVIVSVSGGVADVVFKPRGVAVTIVDYDVDGAEEEAGRITRDPDGQLCVMGQWPATDLVLGNRHWPQVRQSPRDVCTVHSRQWACPECKKTVSCTYEQLAAAGAPYCPNCDLEMTLA
jgi:hypothetical protein